MRLLELYRILDEEAELLFELRNVLNVDDLKLWANRMGETLASPFQGEGQIAQAVQNWGSKALLKFAINEVPGTTVRMPKDEWVSLGAGRNAKFSDLPVWAQQALKRGDELTYVDPAKRTIRQPRDFQRDIAQVRDWLRFKYEQNPREFTPNRLARIPWQEALRLTDEYHATLAAEQAKIATLSDVKGWWEENKRDILGREGGEWDVLSNAEQQRVIRHFERDTGKKVKPPEDDPTGREPFIRYTQKGEQIEDDDFQPAPEIGDQWVKLKTDQCVKYEGTLMGHCVGGYGREVEEGSVWIYSFRDKDNEPHVTIEVIPQGAEGDGVDIVQIKGKENSPPVTKYHGKVIDFIKKLKSKYEVYFEDEAQTDLFGMGMFLEGYGSAIKIKGIQPPYNMEKFIRYELAQDPPEEDEFGDPGEYPDEEVTNEEEGNLFDLVEYDQEVVVPEILAYLMNTGGSCWYGDEEENYETGASTRTSICYNGDDKYTAKRKWVYLIE